MVSYGCCFHPYAPRTAQQSSIDTRALVLEVAEKHDSIVKYRNEINVMEEELKRKDVHIHFKDEIIRELRRECKKVIFTQLRAGLPVFVCFAKNHQA